MFIPTVSQNDARKQAYAILKSIAVMPESHNFDRFFGDTVYREEGIYYMKGTKEVFEALSISIDKNRALMATIRRDKDANDVHIEVVLRNDKVMLRKKNCYLIARTFEDYRKAVPCLDIMKAFKNYEITFDFSDPSLPALGGTFRGKDVNIIHKEDHWTIDFPKSKRLGSFGEIADARRFLELFH